MNSHMRKARYILTILLCALSCDTGPTEPIRGSGIALTPEETLLQSDDSLQLIAHRYGPSHNQPLTFSISDSTLAEIGSDGLLKSRAVTGGDAIALTVLVREGVFSDKSLVTLLPSRVATVNLMADSLTIVTGDTTGALSAVLRDKYGRMLTGRTITFSSRTPELELIPHSLRIASTFRAGGDTSRAYVIATAENRSDSILIIVKPRPVARIEVDSISVRAEDSTQVAWNAFDVLGRTLTGRTASITSLDTTIVRASTSGTVIGAAYSDTLVRFGRIVVEVEGISGFRSVRVDPAIAVSATLSIAPGRHQRGDTIPWSLILKSKGGVSLMNRHVDWTITDTTVATIDAAWQLQGRGYGATVLSARADSAFASVRVVVEALRESTGLPIVWINAEKAIQDRETWINSTVTIGESASSAVKLSAQIRGRGNTTWTMDKKPYRIRLRSEASVLGLSPARNWVLLANFADRSLIRNALALSLGKHLDVPFAHDQRFVDVFLDDQYIGNYLLTEHNEVHPSRVAISTVTASQIRSGSVFGGYYIESNQREDEEPLFRSAFVELPFTIKEPSAVPSSELIPYVKRDFDAVESFLCSTDTSTSLASVDSVINVESFINTYWVNELFKNIDFWVSSTYLFRPLNGPLSMGPVWDYDLSAGNAYWDAEALGSEGWYARSRGLVSCLMNSVTFQERVNARWREIRLNVIPNWLDEIDTYESQLARSANLNFTRWPILGVWVWPSPQAYGSYPEEVGALRSWLSSRVTWIDGQIH